MTVFVADSVHSLAEWEEGWMIDQEERWIGWKVAILFFYEH
jgi:hypothetical protein